MKSQESTENTISGEISASGNSSERSGSLEEQTDGLQNPESTETKRTKVSFEIVSGDDDKPMGKINLVLFDDIVPKTVANFKALASGKNRALP